MSSFFTLPGSAKRKRADAAGSTKSKKVRQTDMPSKKSRKRTDKDEISSEEEEDDDDVGPRGEDDEGEDEEFTGETAAEKRLRLAQQYLDNIRQEVGNATPSPLRN